MYSLSSLLKIFADQVDKAELRRLTKQTLKMGSNLQKLVKPSNFFKAGRTHKDASPVAYKSIFIDISTPIRIFMVE